MTSAKDTNKENLDQAIEIVKKLVLEEKLLEAKKQIALLTKENHKNPKIYNIYGVIFFKENNYQKAIEKYLEAIKVDPNYNDAYKNLGLAYYTTGRLKESKLYYQKYIGKDKKSADARNNLGLVLNDLDELDEAIFILNEAVRLNPNYAEAYFNLGVCYKKNGNVDKAIICYENAIKINPFFSKAYNNLLFNLNNVNKIQREKYLDLTKKYRNTFKKKPQNKFTPFCFEKNPNKIRVGFVSGDFGPHPVSLFLIDFIKNLKKYNIESIAYSNFDYKDEYKKELEQQFDVWKSIINKKNIDVVNEIRADKIHILIDLSGHTAKNRLPIFFYKPAPVQVTWLGYNASTGISEIDYIVGDNHAFPEDMDNIFTEKIWRLPESMQCFSKKFEMEINELPAKKNGFVTYGSLNKFSKINLEVVKIWSQILKSVPKSKLLLISTKNTNSKETVNILREFSLYKIDLERIILKEYAKKREDVLNLYSLVDIALDTFPVNGTTTSHEAIWAGVPLLTKKGYIPLSKMGESLNKNISMENWIAKDSEEYLEKAIKFSSNLNELSNIRKNLRNRARDSSSFNVEKFTRYFQKALWDMWKIFQKKRG